MQASVFLDRVLDHSSVENAMYCYYNTKKKLINGLLQLMLATSKKILIAV